MNIKIDLVSIREVYYDAVIFINNTINKIHKSVQDFFKWAKAKCFKVHKISRGVIRTYVENVIDIIKQVIVRPNIISAKPVHKPIELQDEVPPEESKNEIALEKKEIIADEKKEEIAIEKKDEADAINEIALEKKEIIADEKKEEIAIEKKDEADAISEDEKLRGFFGDHNAEKQIGEFIKNIQKSLEEHAKIKGKPESLKHTYIKDNCEFIINELQKLINQSKTACEATLTLIYALKNKKCILQQITEYHRKETDSNEVLKKRIAEVLNSYKEHFNLQIIPIIQIIASKVSFKASAIYRVFRLFDQEFDQKYFDDRTNAQLHIYIKECMLNAIINLEKGIKLCVLINTWTNIKIYEDIIQDPRLFLHIFNLPVDKIRTLELKIKKIPSSFQAFLNAKILLNEIHEKFKTEPSISTLKRMLPKLKKYLDKAIIHKADDQFEPCWLEIRTLFGNISDFSEHFKHGFAPDMVQIRKDYNYCAGILKLEMMRTEHIEMDTSGDEELAKALRSMK